jgi:fibro-slime domain-containing protein
VILTAACGNDSGSARSDFTGGSSGTSSGSGGASGTSSAVATTGAGGSIVVPPTGTGGSVGGGANQDASVIVGPLPQDFTATEVGGYKLGPPVGANGSQTGLEGKPNCNMIVGVVRDFKPYPGGHPDFEHFAGADPTYNLVGPTLGTDLKPVYASKCEVPNPPQLSICPTGQMTTGKANFDQWYRLADGVNMPYLVYFMFGQGAGGVITFSSDYFFPLDNAGWMDPPATGNDGKPHNFSFTTELHTKFKYNGGETFKFTGDDDLWVFINGKLAIDLGGLHGPLNGSVDLDAKAADLGIAKGSTYPLELFHAERHTTASHFRLDTTLTLVDCGTIPPDVPR